ncbi:MAG: beta-ketoacyl-ACP synthase II [Lachnospiraceae bacterium]|nr:beta-ketoacyl-ACP synthase II [Lachnospiraceae bacterium]
MRRVVVTGLGAITPIGNNVEELWNSVVNGVCGIAPITNYDTTDRKVTLAGEVKNFNPETVLEKAELRKMDKYTVFALTAAKEAMEDSLLDISKEDSLRCGVIFSSGIGGLGTIQTECERGNAKGFDRVSPHFIPMAISNMAAGHIAIKYGFHGMCSCVVTACAGASNAIGDAFRQIRDGYLDVCMCGGSEASITPFGIGGFTSLHALSTQTDSNRASIPFDKERNGFVMGEGAGALILEEYEHAMARGAKIYCEIGGYGATCDANHVTAPLEDGSMAAKCMEMAMEDAKVSPEKIQYINAHGTSTKLNDKGETAAIKLAFKDHAYKLCVSSTKSMTGHLLGASGGVEAIITALSVKNDVVPATINYKNPDEECDLDIVPNESRKQTVDYALSNSLGFGGHNASILFKKVGK